MKRELRDVSRQVEELERALKHQERNLADLAQEITALTARLDELEITRREAEKAALTTGHALEQLETELAKSNARVVTFLQELDRVIAERTEEDATIAQKQTSVAAHEQERVTMEQAMAAAQEELARLKAARDAAAHTASEMLARLAGLEERRIGAAAALQRIEAMTTEIASRRNELDAQIVGAAAEQQQRQAENLQLTAQLAAFATEKINVEQRGIELKNESELVRGAMVAIEQELRELRAALDQARDRKGELAATAAKLQSDLEHMRETCLNELNIRADELIRLGLALVAGEQLAAEEAVYREMRTRLDNMGPVNMMALEEYKETAERHAFLETQRKDLLDSIENTQKTIKEIDEFSRAKFKEAFERINENFQAAFRKLFGGGNAFMKLTDEENTAESGIDVVASPPGKRLQNVLLLSGGEKALTAIALLVGIFQYTPSPFCILDEVDAPLDEANVGRFTELVKEMSERTQFIIVTHSKKTMSVAPVMYGVTMQEPGVSKLVSVRFGEPESRVATA
jgi:chromosome segregation protein